MRARERFEFARELLSEGKEHISKGEPVQASEKLYKSVEECIKLLSERERLPEYEEAKGEGRWWSRLLVRAAGRLSRDLEKKEIGDAWTWAFNLHIWGFHECALDLEDDVEQAIPYMEWLVNFVSSID